MWFRGVLSRVSVTASATIVAFMALSAPVTAQDSLDLELAVAHVTALPGEQGVSIPIYLGNCCDSIVVFQLWLMLDRPDIMEFDMTLDTTGTLISDWGYSVNSLGGNNHDILITSGDQPPFLHAIGYPQTGELPLVKLVADAYNIPDSMTERTAVIHVVAESLDRFSFLRPNLTSIGIRFDTLPDTSWYLCTLWSEPDPDSFCLSWEQVAGPPADSIDIDTNVVASLDTSRVSIDDGSLTVLLPSCCNTDGIRGDADNDCTFGCVTVADLSYLVAYLFNQGAVPVCEDEANADGDCTFGCVTVADLSYLVAYLFQSDLPPPPCL